MKSFAWFIGLFVFGFALMALLAYPLYDALTPTFEVRFHRVATRLGMLGLLIGFVLLSKRLQLADRVSLGYGLERPQFFRQAGIGLLLGIATMLPVIGLMLWLDLREWRAGIEVSASFLLTLAFSGLMSGIAVALIEETFFRGAMHTGIARESGTRLAILLTALLYSAVHFLGRYRIPEVELGFESGLRFVIGTFAMLTRPLDILDAFLALFAVGLLLGMVRALTGNIAACLGLHAGWVWMIAFLRETSKPAAEHEWRFLLSQFDGVVGWLVLAWTAVMGLALWKFYTRASATLNRPRDPRRGG